MAERRTANILMVDDRPENLLALEAILQGLGHELIRASSGEEALKVLLTTDVAVILLDVQMPGMDGFEATTRIRERERATGMHVPIVAMTAHAMKGDRERCLEIGMDDYLTKPFDTAALRGVVERFFPDEAAPAAEAAKA